MSELERLSLEADMRRAEFEAAVTGATRRMRPSKLLDDVLGQMGPAPALAKRMRAVGLNNPLAVAICAASASWIAWKFLQAGSGLIRNSTPHQKEKNYGYESEKIV